MRHAYSIVVDNGRAPTDERGPFTARVDAIPHEGQGDTPILALAALARVLERWSAGGSDEYLDQGGTLRS